MTKYFADIWDHLLSNKRVVVMRALLALLVLWFLFGDFGLVTRIRMEMEHRMLQDRLAEEQKEIAADQETIKHATHPDSIEKVAREKYNFRGKDETVFIIRKK
jgi:cell division protein FtsB